MDYLFLGFIQCILALTGDLLMSFLKRGANIKDGSNMLGPHGGIIDRMDSTILIVPFIYWYALEYYAWTHSPNYDFDKINITLIMNFFHWQGHH